MSTDPYHWNKYRPLISGPLTHSDILTEVVAPSYTRSESTLFSGAKPQYNPVEKFCILKNDSKIPAGAFGSENIYHYEDFTNVLVFSILQPVR